MNPETMKKIIGDKEFERSGLDEAEKVIKKTSGPIPKSDFEESLTDEKNLFRQKF